ncbi:MAG: AAA family ATPase [Muribaculaceae bacterium]|nr:AAA family ATPase [Muribaculaceae bacterium]
MLTRKLTDFLTDFYANQKTALMLTGARQTGKTFAIRELGKSYKSFIEVNFIKSPEAINLFKNVYSAEEILLRLSAFTDYPLIKGDTLIFFDEVQCCEDIVTAIKFLVDEGSYRYALSGSLLGVELKDLRSVPVGYMSVKEVYPLDFEEFLINAGVAPRIFRHLRKCWEDITPVDEVVHERLINLFRLYSIVGGMPAAVERYLSTNDLNVVVQTQKDIISLYKKDISQYATKDKLKIKEIFNLIPSELDAKNKRFILKRLNEHAKYDRYQNDFLWLSNAGVAIPVYNVSEPRLPLKLAETRNLFKLFSNDVGLLAAQYADSLRISILSGDIDVNFGAIFENAVAQELLCHGINPYYFNSKRMGELDFVIAGRDSVIPIEVKSGKDYERHNALRNVLECKEYDIEKAYVLCHGNMKSDGRIIYAPIYMTMFITPAVLDSGKYIMDLSGLQ